MQRETVRPAGMADAVRPAGMAATVGPVLAPPTPPAIPPLSPTLVRFAAQALRWSGRFGLRSALLGSTVGNAPAEGKPVLRIRRGTGWPARTTIDAAEAAEVVRLVWVAGHRLRLAEEGERLRARCMLRAESVADAVRWDELAGDGQ